MFVVRQKIAKKWGNLWMSLLGFRILRTQNMRTRKPAEKGPIEGYKIYEYVILYNFSQWQVLNT